MLREHVLSIYVALTPGIVPNVLITHVLKVLKLLK